MLKITKLVGSGTYFKDIAKRTIEYIEKGKYDELLTLVVIHHGSDFVKIAKILKRMSFKTENLKNDVFGLDTYFKFILLENEEYEEIEDEDRIVEEEDEGEDSIIEEEYEEDDEGEEHVEESDDSETSDDSDDDTLSSNLMCLSYTEKEYETEMTMGNLEYDWSANSQFNNWLKLNKICQEELKNFGNDLCKEIMQTRKDFETVEEWKNGTHENSISNRFGELKKGCSELKKLMNKESGNLLQLF
uniref:Uncharacterized protein n=1 Tax=Meloidogyne enterolobii TaxID=390850 RepID=A0A6V7UH30_MELEN|nr:unnamed protein product [Meloidogyne enterolobii]